MVTRKIKFGKNYKIFNFLLPYPHSQPHTSQDQVADDAEDSNNKDNGEDSVPPIETTSLTFNIVVAVFTRYGIMRGIEHDFIIYEYFKVEAGEGEREWERGSEYRIGAIECRAYGGNARDD